MLGRTVGDGVGLNVVPASVSPLATSVLDIEDPPAEDVVGACVCSAVAMSDCAVAPNGGWLLESTPELLGESTVFKVTSEPFNADNCR